MQSKNLSFIKGYVYEPYINAISQPHIVFDCYTSGYTAGESMYMGSRFIQWRDVYVEIPK